MATAAVALMARARREVISHFMAAAAVSADSAVAYVPGRRIRRRQFDRLLKAGVVRDADDGRYWLDLPRYDLWTRRRHRGVGLALGAVAVTTAMAVLFG